MVKTWESKKERELKQRGDFFLRKYGGGIEFQEENSREAK